MEQVGLIRLASEGEVEVFKANIINVEELVFDHSNPILRLSSADSITTLTFSGQATDGGVSISGLGDQDLTVNATLDHGGFDYHQQTISSGGSLTVNL